MSTRLVNRVQSAYPRSNRRSATNVRAPQIKQRSVTSMDAYKSPTDSVNQPAWRKVEPSTCSGTISDRRRSKTASISVKPRTQSTSERFPLSEIENLLRSLDQDDSVIVQVDCLANYRKLVQTIDLRETSLDCKSLCTLQQRENRIVQRNACRDRRFRSLLDVLEPSNVIGAEQNAWNLANHKNVSESNDHRIEC